MAPYEKALLRLLNRARLEKENGKKAADFLLSLYDATTCGGFDILEDTKYLDKDLLRDMDMVYESVTHHLLHLPTHRFNHELDALKKQYRPELMSLYV